MTTTLNPSVPTNGRSRKSLADQLDRLDQILDGLADGLNEAVASAVQQAVAVAVQEAVRGILVEVLTSPDLLAKLRTDIGLTTPADGPPAPTPAPVVRPSLVAKITGTIGAWLGAGWRAATQTVRQALKKTTLTRGSSQGLSQGRIHIAGSHWCCGSAAVSRRACTAGQVALRVVVQEVTGIGHEPGPMAGGQGLIRRVRQVAHALLVGCGLRLKLLNGAAILHFRLHEIVVVQRRALSRAQ
jgi:hypothetical protein